ncbi:hypothetical protein EV421DRAFT_1335722 [Armillaria borealis]|uniref:Uncharacterized protein n=1 Tax=Armillaria borealis TaxID=47425 RepID=A0AA39MI88_9AGAR|nr:hypothetical protein EV421DRAFT_1335722 [Armillaria borealis]
MHIVSAHEMYCLIRAGAMRRSRSFASRLFRDAHSLVKTFVPCTGILLWVLDIQNPTGIDLIDEELPNINKPPSQMDNDYCKVLFNCRGLIETHNFPFVQLDYVPILPFPLVLQRRMHGYTSPCIIESYRRSQTRMGKDVAMEAYLARDPKWEPWLIQLSGQCSFPQFLTNICIALPHVTPVVEQYLALSAHLSSVPQGPIDDMYLPLTKIPVAARHVPDDICWILDSYRVKEQSKLRSPNFFHPLYTICQYVSLLSGTHAPGDFPWYSRLPLYTLCCHLGT